MTCSHKGTYADDCLLERVEQNRCYIVGTCDKELKVAPMPARRPAALTSGPQRRIRKIPGVPIMFLRDRRYTI